MNRGLELLCGIGLGAGAVYFLDPQGGKRRRALLRDRAANFLHDAEHALDVVARDVGNRALGVYAEARHLARPGSVHDDGHRHMSFDLLQENWAPATRFLVGATGAGLIGYGATQRAPWACVVGTVGLALAVRGLTNMSFGRMIGVGGRRGIDVQKTVTINAPVDRVFEFWSNYANFHRFMRNVREVTYRGDGHSHWVVAGPAGVPVEWDAAVTQLVPNQVIAWRSEPGSAVSQEGSVRFESAPGGTRVTVRLSYRPPAGALGHAVAGLFGADPKHVMDEDLMRMKAVLETGKMPHDAREAVAAS
jgi:uncharacterized membrane protein